MFNSVVLDVVIGLVFIYLLYSLLVTVLSEMIATSLGLRARNLKEAVDRMLNDEKPLNRLKRLWDSLKLTKTLKNPVVNAFYDHPEIKYLGSSGVFKLPSNFKAGSFSKTLISLLTRNETLTRENLESKLNEIRILVKNDSGATEERYLDPETAEYIRSVWRDAQSDIEKFKNLLENWFNRTMEHTIEWYKRKIRVVTLVLGLLLAWFFNADTFVIVKTLSNDKAAREQMVSMANAYIESNQYAADTQRIKNARGITDTLVRLDTLLAISGQLQSDIAKANNVLGTGFLLPDSVKVIEDKKGKITYEPSIELRFIKTHRGERKKDVIFYSCSDKWCYAFWLLSHHFFGFLVTAIALSLGAPFWFDLLNKLMSLRTSKKESTATTSVNSSDETVSLVNRVG